MSEASPIKADKWAACYTLEGEVVNCASNIHEPPVPATVHGAFKSYWNSDNSNADVWYCERCAVTGEAVGLFTRDEGPRG